MSVIVVVVVELYADIHSFESIAYSYIVERSCPVMFIIQNVEGLCPGMPCRSIGEGSCPVNALTIQNVEGLMPWNALSFKRVKWYHMHMHCCIVVIRRCVIA